MAALKGSQAPKDQDAVQDPRRAMEALHRLLAKQRFETVEDANRFLSKHQGKKVFEIPGIEPGTPQEIAQDLCFDAWEASTPLEARRFARKALKMWPDCADAYNVLAEEEAATPAEREDAYAKAVAAGERALGRNFIKAEAGNFWSLIETRPFMRALSGLADARWEMGKLEEAISLFERMLHLNPNDNQGVRGELFTLYLQLGRLPEADSLQKRYPKDHGAAMEWSRLLLSILQGKPAGGKLGRARASNPHVEGFLLGSKRVGRWAPEMYAWGSREEADLYARFALPAWRAHPPAMDTLRMAFVRL